MTVKSRARARHISPVVTVVTVVLGLGAFAFACADNKRILGDDCIKDQDCQSGICTALRCSAAPPILDRDATPPAVDASAESSGEAGDANGDTGADAAADADSDGGAG